MNVFVAGASGAIGRPLVAELVQDRPAGSSLMSDGERCPVTTPLREGKP